MNFDFGQISQMVSSVQFPINKDKLIQFAQQRGANDQIVGALQHLPDKTFNSPQDIQNELGNLGNLGGFKM